MNRALPQTSSIRVSSAVISTGRPGRLREMSASSRPETSAWPSSLTSALTEILAEVS